MLYQLGKVSDAILQLQVRTMRTREMLAASTAAQHAVKKRNLRASAAQPGNCTAGQPRTACPRPHPQDLEVSLRGYAEVHAALASILYVERPALLEVAEQQWVRGRSGSTGASPLCTLVRVLASPGAFFTALQTTDAH